MGTKAVKKVLIDSGWGVADLARHIGMSREHVSRVINGRYESNRVKKRIAEALAKDYEDIWGEEGNNRHIMDPK